MLNRIWYGSFDMHQAFRSSSQVDSEEETERVVSLGVM